MGLEARRGNTLAERAAVLLCRQTRVANLATLVFFGLAAGLEISNSTARGNAASKRGGGIMNSVNANTALHDNHGKQGEHHSWVNVAGAASRQ